MMRAATVESFLLLQSPNQSAAAADSRIRLDAILEQITVEQGVVAELAYRMHARRPSFNIELRCRVGYGSGYTGLNGYRASYLMRGVTEEGC